MSIFKDDVWPWIKKEWQRLGPYRGRAVIIAVLFFLLGVAGGAYATWQLDPFLHVILAGKQSPEQPREIAAASCATVTPQIPECTPEVPVIVWMHPAELTNKLPEARSRGASAVREDYDRVPRWGIEADVMFGARCLDPSANEYRVWGMSKEEREEDNRAMWMSFCGNDARRVDVLDRNKRQRVKCHFEMADDSGVTGSNCTLQGDSFTRTPTPTVTNTPTSTTRPTRTPKATARRR